MPEVELGLQSLPSELLLGVANFLPCKDLLRFACTCKSFRDLINNPDHDARIWKDKLPRSCNELGVSLQFQRWNGSQLTSSESSRGLAIGKSHIKTFKDLAIEVGQCYSALEREAHARDKSLAEHCLTAAEQKWNTGYTLHADVAFSCACYLAPSLPTFIRYILLTFLEVLNLERTAILIQKAADLVHDSNLLPAAVNGAAWAEEAANEPSLENANAVAVRHLSTLVALLCYSFQFSQEPLQDCIESEKKSQLQLKPLPQIFESLLSTDVDPHTPSVAEHDNVESQQASAHVESLSDSSTPRQLTADGLEGHASISADAAENAVSYTFLGATFEAQDLMLALGHLSRLDGEQQLCEYAMSTADSSLEIELEWLVPLLRPGVADIVRMVMVQPNDFQKEFVAWHMWNHTARENAAAAYEVLSPPHMCNRLYVWLALTSYMASYFVLKSKSESSPIFSHVDVPHENSENVLVGCLIELTMELYSLGFLLAACNTSLLAILQNESSMRPDVADMRYVLAGQVVDIHVTLLEHNQARAVVSTHDVLRECVQWVLALFRLAAPPLFPLNFDFVQRLSKVLFCCMLRLPHAEQQRRCAKAALALCRLCLQRLPQQQLHKASVAELPLPQVDTRTPPHCMLGKQAGAVPMLEERGGSTATQFHSYKGTPPQTPRTSGSCIADPGASSSCPVDANEGAKGMRLLRCWLDHDSPDELDSFLQQQSLDDVHAVGSQTTKSSHNEESSRWSWLWFGKAQKKNSKMSGAVSSKEFCPWLGELQYISSEVETTQVWSDYERELADILEVQGGRDAVMELMPLRAEDGNDGDLDSPWHVISRLYECLAQVCSALGLFSTAALFYGIGIQSVSHLPPEYVLEDALDPLQPGTAPLTSSRYVASTLGHLANELITAADYEAALRTLVFSRSVCSYELKRRQAAPPYGPGWSDGATNEVHALLTFSTAQLAATILELRNRYGLRSCTVTVPRWPQKPKSSASATPGPTMGAADTETSEVPISYTYTQKLAWEAYNTAKGRHVDSCLQALFVLGDIALVTYNLPEARRIFSITGLAAADGAVQHYNLMSQCQSFSAIAGLSLGDAAGCRQIALKCMTMYSFPQDDPLHSYTQAEDDKQHAFCAALDKAFGLPWELQDHGNAVLGLHSPLAVEQDQACTSVFGNTAETAGPPQTVERETVTMESLQSVSTDELLLRAMCEVHQQGRDPHAFLGKLRMRAMAMHMKDCPAGEEEQHIQLYRQQIMQFGQPETLRAAAVAACFELGSLPTLKSVIIHQWGMQVREVLGNLQEGLPQPLQPQQASAAPSAASNTLSSQTATIWELLSYAERPGAMLPLDLLLKFMSASIPGVEKQLLHFKNSTGSVELLTAAARISIEKVSEHVALPHVDCEDVETSSIQFFMHQISLQIHSVYGSTDHASWALSQLASRPNDDIGHVHIWYWAGAVSMHMKNWKRAMMMFRASARCSVEYRHLSMRAKAYVGMCEALLAEAVTEHCPSLARESFVLTTSTLEGSAQAAHGVHVALCQKLGAALGTPTGMELAKVIKTYLHRALEDAQDAEDQGAELRALLLLRLVFQMDGLVKWDAETQGLVWNLRTKLSWLSSTTTLQGLSNRLDKLMSKMGRNAYVTRNLLGCPTVLDPSGSVRMHRALSGQV